MKTICKLALLFLILINVCSCEDIDCSLNNSVKLTTRFYSNGKNVSLNDTLTVSTIGSDSILLNRMINVSKMELPMSFWNATDTLVLTVTSQYYSLKDTIWILKTNTPHFESPNCPSHMFHEITKVNSTHTFIDSISITYNLVNYAEVENLQIHLFNSN